MVHVIEFVTDWKAEIQTRPGRPLEKMILHQGARRCAEVRPRVIEMGKDLIEAADLFFDDGSVARNVPFAAFFFAE